MSGNWARPTSRYPDKNQGSQSVLRQATQALALNTLGFVGRALYLMPDYSRNKSVDLLTDPNLIDTQTEKGI